MTFELKTPISRRRQWEEAEGKSQFSILPNKLLSKTCCSSQSHSPKYDRETDDIGSINNDQTDTACNIVPAGAPVRFSSHGKLKDKEIKVSVTVECENLPKKIPFSKLDLLFVLLSLILYLVDIGLDCFVAYKHYFEMAMGDTPLYFIFTVCFIALSLVVTSLFSLWWYYFEYKIKSSTKQDSPSTSGWILRIIASVLALGPVMRYIDTIRYGLMSRKKHLTAERRQYYFDQMQNERVDGAMLRLFEAFFEAAPQTLLQVFIILRKGIEGEKQGNYFLVAVTMLSICVSMLSLAWSIVAYHKALRLSRHDRSNISHFGLALRFLWRLFEVAPRIVLLAMFMARYKYWLGVFVALHYIMMVIWIWRLKTKFCEKPNCENLFVLVMALVWTFCFFNLKDGHTRKRSVIFYAIFIVENAVLLAIWALNYTDTGKWYDPILISVVAGSNLPMIFFMLTYYYCKHPGDIKLCLPKEYWIKNAKKTNNEKYSVRYTTNDGQSSEREVLDVHITNTEDQTPPELPNNSELSTEAGDLYPPYRREDNSETHSMHSDETETRGTLDDCVEIDGYLETIPPPDNNKRKLQRQDTIPDYQAPVPSTQPSNYGATVPGGAPTVLAFSHSLRDSCHDTRGTTLPGCAPNPALIADQQNIDKPTEEDECPDLPPRLSLSVNLRDSHKPPLPEPRQSILSKSGSNDHSSSSFDDITLVTTLNESADVSHTTSDTTLSPSKIDTSDLSLNTPDRTAAVGADNSCSSIDTPLKMSLNH